MPPPIATTFAHRSSDRDDPSGGARVVLSSPDHRVPGLEGKLAMLEEILGDLKTSIGKAHEALKRDLGKVRTGRAHAGMLDSVRVDYYGVSTPLGQMATVSVPEPRMITVKPWDKSAVKLVEKAIRDSDLGLNPQTDGDLIRLPIPPLTEERRKEMVKVAKKVGEECKVAIRKMPPRCPRFGVGGRLRRRCERRRRRPGQEESRGVGDRGYPHC